MIPIRSTKPRVEQDLTFYCCTLVKIRADQLGALLMTNKKAMLLKAVTFSVTEKKHK